MRQAIARTAATALLALAAAWANAQTGDWGDLAIVSGTLGNQSNRVCVGAPDTMRPADFGCPTYSMYVSTGGLVGINTNNPNANLDVYGTISATNFIGDGSGLTGVIAGSSDRIVSGSTGGTRMVAISDTGYISITQAGANSGWFDPYRGLVTLGVSATGPISGTAGYFTRDVAIRKLTPLATLDVAGTISASDAVQVGTSSLACSSGIPGALRYAGGHIEYCNGTSWGALVGAAEAMGDRIVSGTTNAIAWQDRSLTITTAGTQRMVVGEDGNVGIGTSTPNALLDVAGPAGPSNSGPAVKISATTTNTNLSLFFRSPEARGSVNLGRSGLGQKANALNIESSGDINFYPGGVNQGSERMVLDSGGNVGINTLSPTATLQVSGSFIVSTSAQGSTSPSLYVGTDGNVGIGTSSPTASLNIASFVPQIVFRDNTTGADSRIDANSSSGSMYLDADYANTSANSFLGLGVDGVRKMYINLAGISISKSAALAALDVGGTISASDAIQVGQSSLACSSGIPGAIRYNGGSLQYCNGTTWTTLGTSAGVTGSGSATAVAFWSGTNALSYDGGLYWDNGNKRLGIGTTTPTHALTVGGSAAGTTLLNVVNSDATGSSGVRGVNDGGVIFAAGVGNSGSARFANAGFVNIVGNYPVVLGTNNTERVRVDGGGNVGIGTQSPTATLQVSGSFTVSTSGQTTTPSLYVGTDGRVGIGTNNPVSALDVSGTGYVHLVENGAVGLYRPTGNLNHVLLELGSDAYGVSNSSVFTVRGDGSTGIGLAGVRPSNTLDVSGSFRVRTSAQTTTPSIFVRDDGRVGIGTSAPSINLHVYDDDNYAETRVQATGADGFAVLSLKNDAREWRWQVQGADQDKFYLWDNTDLAVRMAVTPAGNVGIGTNAPNISLTVVGEVQVSNSGVVCDLTARGAIRYIHGTGLQYCNGSAFTTLGAGGGGASGDRIVSGTTNAIAWQDRSLTITTAGAQRMIVGENGYVGIGTSSPRGFLDVSGSGYIVGYGSGVLEVYRPTSLVAHNIFNLRSDVGGSQFKVLSVRGNGSVGVNLGEAAPSATLHVSGTISASDAIQVGSSSLACSSGIPGAIRYSSVSSTMEYCNSTAWVSMGPSDTVPVSFHVHKNGANQTVTTNLWTKVTWPAETYDTNNNFASHRFQPTVPGLYLLTGNVGCVSGNECRISFYKNGVMTLVGPVTVPYGSNSRVGMAGFMMLNGTTDYVEMYGYNGGSTSFEGSNTVTWFQGSLIGPQSSGGGGGSDNLGNHIAEQTLQMGVHNIVGTGVVSVTNVSATRVQVTSKLSVPSITTAAAAGPGGDRIVSGSTVGYVATNGGFVVSHSNPTIWLQTASGGQARMVVGGGRTGNGWSHIDLVGDTTYSTYGMQLVRGNTGPNASSAIYHRGTGGMYLYAIEAGHVQIGTNNVERLTVGSTGSIRFHAYGAGTLMTDASGNITASSDERLKDIQGGYTRGLEDIQKLHPITYRWTKKSGFDDGHSYSGFGAQDVRKAIPEAVSEGKDGYLTLSDRPILAASVNAIKELKAANDILQNGLKAANDNDQLLRAEIDALRRELRELKKANRR